MIPAPLKKIYHLIEMMMPYPLVSWLCIPEYPGRASLRALELNAAIKNVAYGRVIPAPRLLHFLF
jgi:hypothetical protein